MTSPPPPSGVGSPGGAVRPGWPLSLWGRTVGSLRDAVGPGWPLSDVGCGAGLWGSLRSAVRLQWACGMQGRIFRVSQGWREAVVTPSVLWGELLGLSQEHCEGGVTLSLWGVGQDAGVP